MSESALNWKKFTEEQDDTAFGKIVSLHIDPVYAVAMRRTGGRHDLAEDIVQAAFTDLAKQRRQIRDGMAVGSWLLRHTAFLSSHALRSEGRRLKRQYEAVMLQDQESHHDTGHGYSEEMDAALAQLNEGDRTAIIGRFYAGLDFKSLAAQLGTTSEAAQMRVGRAARKLKDVLIARGLAPAAGASLIAALMQPSGVQAAPMGLAATISAKALLLGGSSPALVLSPWKVAGLSAGLSALAFLLGRQVPVSSSLPVAAAPVPVIAVAAPQPTTAPALPDTDSVAQLADALEREKARAAQLEKALAQAETEREKPIVIPPRFKDLMALMGEASVAHFDLQRHQGKQPKPGDAGYEEFANEIQAASSMMAPLQLGIEYHLDDSRKEDLAAPELCEAFTDFCKTGMKLDAKQTAQAAILMKPLLPILAAQPAGEDPLEAFRSFTTAQQAEWDAILTPEQKARQQFIFTTILVNPAANPTIDPTPQPSK